MYNFKSKLTQGIEKNADGLLLTGDLLKAVIARLNAADELWCFLKWSMEANKLEFPRLEIPDSAQELHVTLYDSFEEDGDSFGKDGELLDGQFTRNPRQ